MFKTTILWFSLSWSFKLYLITIHFSTKQFIRQVSCEKVFVGFCVF